jgi:hypothetical protein
VDSASPTVALSPDYCSAFALPAGCSSESEDFVHSCSRVQWTALATRASVSSAQPGLTRR